MNDMDLVVELKTNIAGLTETSVPSGGSITALYTALGAPTFVTVLVSFVELLRLGIVMEGKFTSRMESCSMGHSVGCPVSIEIDELLYDKAQR